MRLPAAAMALGMLAALIASAWAAGCTDLSSDCDLNLTCASLAPEPLDCGGIFIPGACDDCLQESCCEELADCDDDEPCITYCLFGTLPLAPECDLPPTVGPFKALEQCTIAQCASPCAPADQCNPVTNNGCPAGNGSGCDLVYPGIFVCIPPFGQPAAICEPCDILMGPFCGPGLHCLNGSNECARYCCTDADCGTGRCELTQITAFGANFAIETDMVGLCVSMTPGEGAACDAPAQSVTNGACFGGFPPM